MTLDEAIKHAEEVANDMELCCKECAEDHRQLAGWLKELKQYREQTTTITVTSKYIEINAGDRIRRIPR